MVVEQPAQLKRKGGVCPEETVGWRGREPRTWGQEARVEWNLQHLPRGPQREPEGG